MGVRNCADIGENLQKILKVLLADPELGKLLYYTDKDPLNPSHTAPSVADLYEKYIKIIPKVTEDETGRSIVVVKVDGARGLPQNQEFKTVALSIEIFVPFEQWFIKDINLRIFAIMGRIQKLLNGLTINGVGKLEGGDFEAKFFTEEVGCYIALYSLVSYD